MSVSESGTLPPLPKPTAREQSLADDLRRERAGLLDAGKYLSRSEREKTAAIANALNIVVYRLEHPRLQGIG